MSYVKMSNQNIGYSELRKLIMCLEKLVQEALFFIICIYLLYFEKKQKTKGLIKVDQCVSECDNVNVLRPSHACFQLCTDKFELIIWFIIFWQLFMICLGRLGHTSTYCCDDNKTLIHMHKRAYCSICMYINILSHIHIHKQ